MSQQSKISAKLIYLVVIAAMLAVMATITSAQSETATVLGSVRDANGAVLVGAKVEIKNSATSIASTTVSDPNGDFQFVNLKIGNYRITVEANGFGKTIAEVNLTVNSRQRVDLTLSVASATETVTVTGAADLLESASSDKGQVIQRQQIVALHTQI